MIKQLSKSKSLSPKSRDRPSMISNTTTSNEKKIPFISLHGVQRSASCRGCSSSNNGEVRNKNGFDKFLVASRNTTKKKTGTILWSSNGLLCFTAALLLIIWSTILICFTVTNTPSNETNPSTILGIHGISTRFTRENLTRNLRWNNHDTNQNNDDKDALSNKAADTTSATSSHVAALTGAAFSSRVINTEMNDIHYVSGNGNVHQAYRLGDVFVMWYQIQYDWTFEHLVGFYTLNYPNTIAQRYLIEVGEEQYGDRNLTALLNVMDQMEEEIELVEKQNSNALMLENSETMNGNSEMSPLSQVIALPIYPKPSDDELVIHLRLGDVLTAEMCTDTNVPIREMWYGGSKTNFINRDMGTKSNYNQYEFTNLLKSIPSKKRQQIKKCTLVGASFVGALEHENRSVEYVNLVKTFLTSQSLVNCGSTIHHFDSPNPDQALMYMASSKYFISAMGGFAQIAAGCVRARGNYALYDQFNGRIAGDHSDYFTPYQSRTYKRSYIDWDKVTYHPKSSSSQSQESSSS